MKTLVFNYTDSKIPQHNESLCLRYSYLISDWTITAGTSYYDICFDHYYTPVNIVEKAKMIAGYYKSKNDKDWDIKAEEVQQMMKAMNKMKHHSKEGIVHLKKFEHSLDNLFKDIKKELLEALQISGLPQLMPLTEEGLIRINPVSLSDPEEENDEMIPVSKLMQFLLPEDETTSPELFCLDNHIFHPEFFQKLNIAVSAEDRSARSGKGFIHQCFPLPNINLLSVTELQTVKNQLKDSADRFNLKMNEWIKMTRANAVPADTHSFFIKTIMPAAEVLCTLMENNEILKHCGRLQNNKVKVMGCVGELPAQIILDYYKHFDAIKEGTWNKLMQAKQTSGLLKGRMPVMITLINISEDLQLPEEKEQDQILPTKKSLSID